MTDSRDYYDRNARSFIAETINVDMAEHRARFLGALPRSARILDAGSGSGRDTLAFLKAGHQVEAFDASTEMALATTALTGINARVLSFEDFAWEGEFDGIWACASLLHVPRAELPAVLDRLAAVLRPDGVIYASFKIGESERQVQGRYFNNMTPERMRWVLDARPDLTQSDLWISQDQRPDRRSESWLNVLIRKVR